MSLSPKLALFLFFAIAPAAHAQFELFLVNGNVEQPVSGFYNLGSFYQNEVASARFRLRNTSAARATVFALAADGAGFALSGAPPLPAQVDPRGALDFTVTFRSADLGSYSATLRSEGISVLLSVTVLPRLTYTFEGQPLGTAAVNFGTVERGGSVVRQFAVENLAPLILTVPAISVEGTAFSLAGPSPSGTALEPRQTRRFDVRFLPVTAGSHTGRLVIGDRSYALAGVSVEPALPKPVLSIDLSPVSAQQGSLVVNLDSAARSSGTGSVTLEFQPLTANAADPAILFASGSRTLAFTVSPGDTQPVVSAFQTGTTAGILTFTVSLGGATDRKSLTIPGAQPAIASTGATRSADAVEVRIAGFDNTRTIGPIAYTFFDASGAAISPAAIRVDSASEFSRFFPLSDAGGNFLLRALFPVTGDTSRIVAFEAELTNSAGTVRTARTAF